MFTACIACDSRHSIVRQIHAIFLAMEESDWLAGTIARLAGRVTRRAGNRPVARLEEKAREPTVAPRGGAPRLM